MQAARAWHLPKLWFSLKKNTPIQVKGHYLCPAVNTKAEVSGQIVAMWNVDFLHRQKSIPYS